MAPVRGFSLYESRDQWRRASHEGTAIDPETGGVQLAFALDLAGDRPISPAGPPAGLAFDSGCRLYHSRPAEGRLERVLWRAEDPLASAVDRPDPFDVFESAPMSSSGFQPADPDRGPLRSPRGLAVDADDHLFIAESGARRLLVVDLAAPRIVRRVGFSVARGPATPLDVAAVGRTVWVLTRPFGIFRLTGASGPVAVDLRDP